MYRRSFLGLIPASITLANVRKAKPSRPNAWKFVRQVIERMGLRANVTLYDSGSGLTVRAGFIDFKRSLDFSHQLVTQMLTTQPIELAEFRLRDEIALMLRPPRWRSQYRQPNTLDT